jgi:hypothetical protein
MKSLGKIIGLTVLLVAFVMPLSAPRSIMSEGYACPEIVTQAMTATTEVCDGAGRNQACYGHVQLAAEPQTGVSHFVFSQSGDVENVVDIQSLRLSAMNVDAGVWGVALMRLQASLPEATPNKNITLLMFGEVETENAVTDTPLANVTVQSSKTINVRLLPSSEAVIVTTAQPQDTLLATGRNSDSSWLRVKLEDGRAGWVYAPLVSSADDLQTLDVVEPASIYYAPMQAFYFQSGVDDAACPEAPNSGLLIQTPEGVGKVTFLINEVDIQLGSTVFFEAQPGGEMTVSVVEGSAVVTTGGVSYQAVAGTQIGVPLGDDMKPSGPPSMPRAYEMETVAALPVGYLPRAVTIASPLNPAQLTEYLESPESGVATDSTGTSGEESTTGATTVNNASTDGGWETAPGLDGAVPPGQGGDTPPGQIGKDPKEPKK